MAGIFLKWGFLLIVILAVVFGLSKKEIRTPIIVNLLKFKWQILITAIVFLSILTIALAGT